MALEKISSLIFGKAKQRTKIGELIVDVTDAIVTSRKAIVTEFPVEKGSDPTDHVRVGTISLRLEGFISSSPTDEMKSVVQSLASGVGAGVGLAIGSALKVQGGALLGAGLGIAAGTQIGQGLGLLSSDREEVNYAQKAMLVLLRMQEAALPLTIQTFFFPTNSKENIFSDMIITDLDFPQSAAEGDGMKFSLTARQVTFVSLQLVGVSSDFIKGLQAGNSAPKVADLGRQAKKEAPPKAAAAVEEVSSKSLLVKAGDLFGNIGKSLFGG